MSVYRRMLVSVVLVVTNAVLAAPPTVGVMPIDGDQPAWAEAVIVDLTRRLSDAELTVVDRSTIDATLAEHELSLQQMVRQPLRQGGLLGCEYLVLLQAEGTDDERPRRIEALAIEVASGNVVTEGAWSVGREAEQLEKISQTLTQAIEEGILRSRSRVDRPTATVLHVTDRGPHDRTRYLEATLRGIAESRLEQRGYRVLRRRYAGRLKEETTLGASGLVRPDAAVLAETADRVVSIEYREKPDPKLTFSQTPMELKLTVRRDGKVLPSATIAFTLAKLAELPVKIGSALPTAKVEIAANVEDDTDSEEAQQTQRRIEAAQLMAEVNTTLRDITLSDDHARRIRLCERIIFLDPTLAEAHYHLGMSYVTHGREHGVPDVRRASLDALRRYLAFSQIDRDKGRRAYIRVMSVFEMLFETHRDDPAELDRLGDEIIRTAERHVHWFTATDWAGYGRATQVDLLPGGVMFDRWWRKQPVRRAEFLTWAAKLAAENPSLHGYQATDVHLRAAEALGAADRHDEASEHSYRALTIAPAGSFSVRNFANRLSRQCTLDEYLARHRTHLSEEKMQRMRAVLQRAWPYSKPPATPADTLTAMYGDWIEPIERSAHIRSRGPWWLVDQMQCRRLNPQPVALPKSVVFTGHVLPVGEGLWFTGVSKDPKEGSYTHTEIFHWPGRDDEAVRPLAFPDGWRDGPRTVYGPRGALGVGQAIVLDDIVVWTDGEPRRGDYDPAPRLFTWRAGSGDLRELTLRDGLPDRSRYCLSRAADGKAILAIAFRTGSVARFDGQRCTLDKRKLPRLLTEAAFIDETIFGYTGHDGQFHRGAADGTGFESLTDSRDVLQSLGLDGPFQPAPPPSNSDLTHLASAGGRVFAAGGWGLAELPANGPVRRRWHPPIFVYWNQLLGVVEANSPLPPAPISQIFADDRDPNRLWIISRVDHVGRTYPRGEALAEAGIDAKPRIHTAYMSGRDDYMLEVKQRWCGVWVTAYDAATDRWSKPVHVSGEIAMVQPAGVHLYFTGIGLHRLPKSNWPTTLATETRERPAIRCVDTLHGQASIALFEGNVNQARDLLQQAIARGVAIDQTRQMMKSLKQNEHGNDD